MKIALTVLLLLVSQYLIAQCSLTNGLPGGNVYSIKTNGQYLFAGTDYGVYFSSDSGNTWTPRNTGFSVCMVTAFTFSSSEVYLASSQGVYYSSNNGLSWTAIANNHRLESITFCGNTLVGNDHNYILRTSNHGQSWDSIYVNHTIFCLLTVNANIYMGTETAVYFSIDTGKTWLWLNYNISYHIKSLASDGLSIYAGSDGQGIYKSSLTGGGQWSSINIFLNTSGDFVSLDLSGQTIYAATHRIGVYKSTDGGYTWAAVNNGLLQKDVVSVCIFGQKVFAGTPYSGIYRTDDAGLNWHVSSDGIQFTYTTTLQCFNDTIYGGSSFSGAFISSNAGVKWNEINNDGMGGNIGIHAGYNGINSFHKFGGYIYSSTVIGLFRTNDGGAHWTTVNNVISGGIICSVNSNLFIYVNDSVLVSPDSGLSWTTTPGLPSNTHGRCLISHGGNLYFGSAFGIYVLNGGTGSWQLLPNGFSGNYITSLAFSGNNFLAGTLHGLFISGDNGNTWNLCSSSSMDIRGIADFNGLAVAVTSDTLYMSLNNGQSWGNSDFIDGLTTYNTLSADSNYIYIGTYLGIWKRQLIHINEISNIDKAINMELFPNPSSGFFKLKIHEPGHYNISILNSTGSTIFSASKIESEFDIDISDRPSGIYLLTLRDRENFTLKKIIKID